MKIISWNVNGIRSVIKKGFFDFLKKENPDILCLQEVRGEEMSFLGFDYKVIYNLGKRKGYAGVCVFSKEKPLSIEKNIGFERFDNEGRFLRLDFSDFILINVYMPHGNRDKRDLDYKLEVYSILIEYLKKINNRKIILCGDFNIAHNELDLSNPKTNEKNIMFTIKEREMIRKLIDIGLIDSFRELNKEVKKFSWWPYYNNLRERNIGWRLDYIFVSFCFKKELKNADCLNDVKGSDHCPVMMEIK